MGRINDEVINVMEMYYSGLEPEEIAKTSAFTEDMIRDLIDQQLAEYKSDMYSEPNYFGC